MLIYVLLGAAAVTALLGHGVDTAVILGVVVINALIGFVQEGKAEKSLGAIRNMLSLRDGWRQELGTHAGLLLVRLREPGAHALLEAIGW